MADFDTLNLKDFTAEIVAAHVAANSVPAAELPALIQSVYGALSALGQAGEGEGTAEPTDRPSKQAIRKSIQPDYLVSFIDGKRYKMLKRHLSLAGHTPESYREAFGLPADYPMVSAAYSEARRGLAKAIGLGTKGVRKAIESVEDAVAPKKRGRKPRTLGDALASAKEHLAG